MATIELTRFRVKPEREQDLVHARDGMIADWERVAGECVAILRWGRGS